MIPQEPQESDQNKTKEPWCGDQKAMQESQHSNQKATQELHHGDQKATELNHFDQNLTQEPMHCDQKVSQDPLHMQGNQKAKKNSRRVRRRIKMNNHEACYQHDVITKFEALISEVRSGQKLGDDHVNAANQLLRSQFENLQALSTPMVGQGLPFDRFDWMLGYAGYGYYQVLHTGSDHWVTIKATSDHEVHVYDRIFVQPTYYSLKRIAAIPHSESHKINLHLERVQKQIGTVDCGVFAIAFLTDLCHGNDPATRHYAGSKVIHNHLIKCFESGQMVPFPSTPITKQPAVKKELNIYCKCRLPLASDQFKLCT